MSNRDKIKTVLRDFSMPIMYRDPAADAILAALCDGAESVAEVEQQEPYLDGTPHPCKTLNWSAQYPNCEDDLEVGAKLYTIPPDTQAQIDALTATLAASCDDERSQLYEAGPGGGCSRALTAEAERDALQARCAELEKDAERLKYLLSLTDSDGGLSVVSIAGWSEEYSGQAWFNEMTPELVLNEIDAAIAQEQGK